MEDEVIKVTSGLIRRMFKNVKAALGKKADTTDVVLIENIGEPMMAAPLDQFCKVPRENICENGLGILEVEKTVSGVATEASSAEIWDYIVWDSTAKKFYAFLSANSSREISLTPASDKYYSNWATRSDYEADGAQHIVRQDRIYMFKEENKFKRWNGSEMQEVCLPLGTASDTAFSGADGFTLKTTVASYEEKIIRAALAGKRIITGTAISSMPTTYAYQYDICYISSGLQKGYYYFNSGNWSKISLSNLTATSSIFKFPVQIAPSNFAHTPFNDVEGMISSVYKGEVVGSYVKWYIIMKTDSEDQTYYAGTSSNPNYYKQPYTCLTTGFNKPWELWLPLSTAKQSVYIDW